MSALSRREVLALGAGSLAALAGCSGTPVSGPSSVFEDISFEGTDMVVRLRADHDVDRVNLVSPDGSLFTSSNVPVGTTTVRLQVLDLDAGAPKHYTPGTNTLVAVAGNEIVERQSKSLVPKVDILDVSQYQPDSGDDFGNLEVTVENSGTAPTWIHNIVYTGAPNYAANVELSGPGPIFIVDSSGQPDGLLQAGEKKAVRSNLRPLVFAEDGTVTESCTGTTKFTMHVGVGTGQELTEEITVTVSGNSVAVGNLGDFSCTSINIEHRSVEQT